MGNKVGAAFGAIVASFLLGLYAWSTLSWIADIVAAGGQKVDRTAGYIYVLTTVAGLVSALVIAHLTVTRPGATPTIGGLSPESTVGIWTVNIVVLLYLSVWILTGVAALIVGVMVYEANNKTISDLGTTWLGLAVSAAYAYFGISPQGGTDDRSLSKAVEEKLREIKPALLADSVLDQLQQKIDAGKILFDTGKPELKDQLLRKNTGKQITPKLQYLVLSLSNLSADPLRVSDLIRASGDSAHVDGRSVDFGNEEIAKRLLTQVATDAKVTELGIDEIIFDAGIAGEADRNKWNYDAGAKHNYDAATLNGHKDHIHFAVLA